LGAVRPGLDILLARVLVIAGHLASELDTTVQHRARTMNQPRIWSDTTQPGQTGWSDGSDAGGLQLRANVDATSGGFIATPAYFARLAGAAPTSMGCITAAAPGGFAFAVRVAGGGPPINAAQAESKGWTVAWFAVELQPNAEPET
jgi:hypothetical protein